jgi:hypothetical protein
MSRKRTTYSATEHYMTKKQTQNDNAGEKNDN